MRLLLDVADPLINVELSGYVDNWHYFWENDPIAQPHLRLRVRWLPSSQLVGYQKLSDFLNQEQGKNNLASWFPGNHGVANQVYRGEANDYGPEVWELTYQDWTSGSKLALAILKNDSNKALTKPRDFHWQRRTHLFTNELLLPEALLSLRQAGLYHRPSDVGDTQIVNLLQALDQLLNP